MPRNEDDDLWFRDEDHRPRSRRSWHDYDPEDDYDDRPGRRRKRDAGPQVLILGVLSLAMGVLALPLGVGCGGIGLVPAAIGLGLGIVGLLVAHQGRRRQSPVLPLCGAGVSVLALVVSVVSLVSFVRTERRVQAEMEKADREEAEREVERARAPGDVQAAAAGGALKVTAAQFYKAYEDDEDRADRRYKNKVLEVTGTFHEVDFTGEAYVVLLRAGGEGDTVDCEFAKNPQTRARLVRLKPGDTVTIRGKCLGGGSTIEACVLVQ
jgi:hypothetical protein